jgi:tetratricopeptide (TPR) repeat protein/2-polyprenyl-3-methyl-5-hydroxy-6-metoxy-1,4-benzoquinol methylase
LAASYYNLANALAAAGDLDDAISHYQRALVLDPDFAEVYNNLASALLAQSKMEEASANIERALALNPNLAEAYVNRGNLLREHGRIDEAAAQYHHALTLKPNYAPAQGNLGALLLAQGNPEGAEEHYRHAVKAHPDLAEAHDNLGFVLMTLGRLEEAIACQQHALALKPDFIDAYHHLAGALLAQGKPMPALGVLTRALEKRSMPETKMLLARCLKDLAYDPDAGKLRSIVIQAMTEPWGRPGDLAQTGANVLKADGEIGECIKRANEAWPKRAPAHILFGPAGPAVIGADPLLNCLLTTAPVIDQAFERSLIAIRCALLETVTMTDASGPAASEALALSCALARQCFLNEYVFVGGEEEIERAARLREEVTKALSAGDPILPLRISVAASYFPLHALPDADSLLNRTWPDAVMQLLTQQIREPREEARLGKAIPRLIPIDAATARTEARHFEKNPHPRWTLPAPAGKRISIDHTLRDRFPLAFFRPLGWRETLDILVVGCCTGQHAIEIARWLSGAQVLAIDRSLPNLAYARRKTRELGLENIDYARADMIDIERAERTFDVIDAGDTLLHLADPLADWRKLLARLRPGGFMALGLSREMTHGNIVTARKPAAQLSPEPSSGDTPGGHNKPKALPPAASLDDILAPSGLTPPGDNRDPQPLVHGRHVTLPRIDTFLTDNDLEFLGFEVEATIIQQYRTQYPQDRTMTDLELWHEFETGNPDTFADACRFWVQRRG